MNFVPDLIHPWLPGSNLARSSASILTPYPLFAIAGLVGAATVSGAAADVAAATVGTNVVADGAVTVMSGGTIASLGGGSLDDRAPAR